MAEAVGTATSAEVGATAAATDSVPEEAAGISEACAAGAAFALRERVRLAAGLVSGAGALEASGPSPCEPAGTAFSDAASACAGAAVSPSPVTAAAADSPCVASEVALSATADAALALRVRFLAPDFWAAI